MSENRNKKWEYRKPPSFPKQLKSYHVLLVALLVIVVFGALVKYIDTFY